VRKRGEEVLHSPGGGGPALSRRLAQVNRNLDADRGYKHERWKIRDRSSITDDPVGVEILGYNQI